MRSINVQLTGALNGLHTLHEGKPKQDIPKGWKEIGVCRHNIGNAYNPSTLIAYYNTAGDTMYEIYRDSCFYPYVGQLTRPGYRNRK